ncbi:hypothetical protein [Novipirellula aureliae]|uniref:hypothetical protein n=1 Tax=Novipirellula aureliae TaxID=2527966 RepID=UPI0011B8206F|nr:hypothetical protein [Novipirellula aureliae]
MSRSANTVLPSKATAPAIRPKRVTDERNQIEALIEALIEASIEALQIHPIKLQMQNGSLSPMPAELADSRDWRAGSLHACDGLSSQHYRR